MESEGSTMQQAGAEAMPPSKRTKVDETPEAGPGMSGLAREVAAGIIAYIREDAPGFSAIIKHRGHDFLVNEIDQSGNVVRLTTLEPPQMTTDSEAAQKAGDEAPVDIYAELAQLTNATVAENVRSMVESEGREPTQVMTEEIDDKTDRVKVHQFIRKHLGQDVTTDTEGKAIRMRSLCNVKAKDIRGGIRGRNRGDKLPVSWGDMPGQFCQFVLYKEGKDTMDAIDYICRTTRLNSRVFAYAGTKDRQAVTVQHVTAQRVIAERLTSINRPSAPIRVGNFTYVKDRLRLGDLTGNRFVIVLRDVKGCPESEVVASLESLREHGFINYYGTQRFGTGIVSTQEVGAKMLKSDWSGAVDLLLMPGEPAGQEASRHARARQHWAEHRNPAAAVKMFPHGCVAERAMLNFFGRKDSTNDKYGAIMAIPSNMRKLYVHGYQSYIWNRAATERIRRHGLDPVPGDLVAVRSQPDEDASPSDESGDRIRKVELVTAENVQQYQSKDIVLPLPGYDVRYPENDIGDFIAELMHKDGLDPKKMKKNDDFISLPGGYRTLFSMPQDLKWELLRYDDPAAPLALTDLDRLEEKEEIHSNQGAHLAIRLEMTLAAGQYATMALRELMHQDTSPAFQITLSREHQPPVNSQKNSHSEDALASADN
ncbi:pseudouridine synthase [Thamnocephalis sphaerospora]|uniref:Pseudouridine synthase n=1 Tax=Thamnocephalis sphaerospora TaxID=78915 RepID=A0A4P9XYL4_9FUNG|nr:pseudouridine synthase [Thamnocephalis sphaerospora]|eukprot:RKP11202.1 pseudouridine synthase [Thamnocephalis sphaerospora]